MSGVYTVQLGQLAGTNHASVGVFIAKADKVTVIRDVSITVVGVPSGPPNLYWNSPGGGIMLFRGTIPSDTTTHLEMRQVVPPGTELMFDITAPGWSLLVTGYEFAVA